MRTETDLRREPGVILYIFFSACVVVWGVLLQFSPVSNSIWNYAYNIGSGLVYLFGGLLAFAYGGKLVGKQGQAIALLIAGQVMWAIASFIWAFYNIYLHVEVPFPSYADIFFVAFSLFFAQGLWVLIDSQDIPLRSNAVYTITGSIILSYAAIFFIFHQMPISADMSFFESLSSLAYPLIESFLVSLTVTTVMLSEKRVRAGGLLLLAGMLLQLAGDYLFSYSEVLNMYWNGGLSDIMFVMSGFMLSLGIAVYGWKNKHV